MGVIPKSLTPKRIESNFDIDFELSSEEMAAIDQLNRNHRFVRVDWWDFSPDDAVELAPIKAAA